MHPFPPFQRQNALILPLSPGEQDTRNQNEYRIMDTVKMYSSHSTDEGEKSGYEYAYIDSGSDTFGIGGKAWIIDYITDRTVQVAGYHTMDTIKHDVPIGTGITAVDLPNGETVLIRANEKQLFLTRMLTPFSPFHKCWKMELMCKTRPSAMEDSPTLLAKVESFH